MEIATILTPLAPAYAVFCFLSEPNINEGSEYEKISTLRRCTGRSFNNLHANLPKTQIVTGKCNTGDRYPQLDSGS